MTTSNLRFLTSESKIRRRKSGVDVGSRKSDIGSWKLKVPSKLSEKDVLF